MCNCHSSEKEHPHTLTIIPVDGMVSKIHGLCRHEIINHIFNVGNSSVQIHSKGHLLCTFEVSLDAIEFVQSFGPLYPTRDFVVIPRKRRTSVRH